MRRAVVAEHDRQPGHPFAADQSDLDFLAVALNGDDGCKARLRKIDVLDLLVGLFEHLPHPEGHGLEVRREQIEVARREGQKQCVAAERHRALLALQAGAPVSLCHRRLRLRASAGDERSVRFRKRNCHATYCTVSAPTAWRRTALSVNMARLNFARSKDSAGAIRRSLQLYDFVHSIGNAFAPPCVSSLQGPRARGIAFICKLPGKSSPLSWSKTIG